MIVLKSCRVARDSMSPSFARLGFFLSVEKGEKVFILPSGENAPAVNLLFGVLLIVSGNTGILTCKPFSFGAGDFHLEVSTVPKLVCPNSDFLAEKNYGFINVLPGFLL
jgi:hypothetical protein